MQDVTLRTGRANTGRVSLVVRRVLALVCALIASAFAFASTSAFAFATPAPPPRVTVQPGDTLSRIAEQNGSTVPAILAANVIADPDRIEAGQVLVVPPAYAPVIRMEVQPGQNLPSIARRYHARLEDLLAINELGERDRAVVGQDLLVPPAPGKPSPALPPGLLVDVKTWPAPAKQGQTVGIRLRFSQPISASVTLGDQAVPLREAADGSRWGVVGLDALTDPGFVALDIRWQGRSGQPTAAFRWPIEVADGGYPTFDIVLPPGKDELLDPELVKAENEKLAAIWARPETEPAWRGRFIRPIGEEFVTSAPFAQRRSYNGGPVSSFHAGQDFAAPEGAPVVAPAAGTVVLAEPLTVRGNAVIVDHGGGVYSGYWHLSRIDVAEGQHLHPGDPIGLVGTTGLSTGNHLHWEMRLHGIAVDPIQWLSTQFP